MAIRFIDLELAFEFVSMGSSFDNEAILDTHSNKIYYIGNAIDDVLPDDIYENEKYLFIPSNQFSAQTIVYL